MSNASRSIKAIGGGLVLVIACSVLAQDWPQWRGANRDGKVTGFIDEAKGIMKIAYPIDLAARMPMRSSSAWTQPVGRPSGKTDTLRTT